MLEIIEMVVTATTLPPLLKTLTVRLTSMESRSARYLSEIGNLSWIVTPFYPLQDGEGRLEKVFSIHSDVSVNMEVGARQIAQKKM